MLCLWAILLAVAHCGSSIHGFVVAPLQTPPAIAGSRSSPSSLLENTADDTTSTQENDEPTKILVNFPDATEEKNQVGYSLNGYTGSSAYQSALNDPLSSRNVAYNMEEFNEDGYGDMRAAGKKRFVLERVLKFPFRALRRVTNKRPKNNVEPGVLILVRHGESVWNANKTFTGE